MQRTFSS